MNYACKIQWKRTNVFSYVPILSFCTEQHETNKQAKTSTVDECFVITDMFIFSKYSKQFDHNFVKRRNVLFFSENTHTFFSLLPSPTSRARQLEHSYSVWFKFSFSGLLILVKRFSLFLFVIFLITSR